MVDRSNSDQLAPRSERIVISGYTLSSGYGVDFGLFARWPPVMVRWFALLGKPAWTFRSVGKCRSSEPSTYCSVDLVFRVLWYLRLEVMRWKCEAWMIGDVACEIYTPLNVSWSLLCMILVDTSVLCVESINWVINSQKKSWNPTDTSKKSAATVVVGEASNQLSCTVWMDCFGNFRQWNLLRCATQLQHGFFHFARSSVRYSALTFSTISNCSETLDVRWIWIAALNFNESQSMSKQLFHLR